MLIICSSLLCKKKYIHSKPKILVKINNFWSFSAKNAWKENKFEIYFLSNKNIIPFLIFWQRYFLKIFVHHGENHDQSWTRNTNWECVVETESGDTHSATFYFHSAKNILAGSEKKFFSRNTKNILLNGLFFSCLFKHKRKLTLNCSCWFQNKISQ